MGKSNSSNKSVVKKLDNGRPTKYSPEKVSLLTAAFANSFTVDQACVYAEISKETYYNWIEKHEGFSDQMERAKHKIGMKAKQVVVGAINKNDVESAKWWLKNKHSDEFGGTQIAGNLIINYNQHIQEQKERFKI